MKKVVFLLILIQSLVLLPPALAEDSWVLWQRVDTMDPKGPRGPTLDEGTEWKIIDAYSQETACKKEMEGVWYNAKEKWAKTKGSNDVSGEPYYVILTNDDGSALILNYICIPGTLDPRRK